MEIYNERMSVPDDHLLSDHSHDGGMKDKLYHFRSRAIDKMNTMKRDMNDMKRDVSEKWMPMASERMNSMRSGMKMKADELQREMKTRVSGLEMQLKANPTKWAGIAAGAGFGLGLIGRIMRHRSHRAAIPRIVVIEGAC